VQPSSARCSRHTGVPYKRRRRICALVLASGLAAAPRVGALAQDTASGQASAPGNPGTDTITISRLYGGVEYLGWWVKGAPLAVPLVSTGPISTTHHGWLSSPDSTILYGAPHAPAQGGNDTQSFPIFSGTRLTVGYDLDASRRYAVELSGFALQSRTAGFDIQGNQDGLPIINIPVYNTTPYTPGGRPGGLPPAEDGLPAALPSDPDRFDSNAGVFTGRVKITNSLQLWGASLTGVASLYRTPSWEVSGLAGFRFLRLAENFNLFYQSIGISGVYAGEYGTATDTFGTQNHFYGSLLGVRGRYSFGRMFVEASGSVAFGASNETLNVNGGFSSINFQQPTRTGPEGVFAQPANEGTFSSVHFAVVPEVALKIGYDITPSIRVTIGYDFLYDSSVIRPTDQIDRNIPKGQTFLQGGSTVSTTSPTRIFRTTDFYAQGVSVGVAYRF
jgi:Putative beta barrel porin-7 (BBP7)